MVARLGTCDSATNRLRASIFDSWIRVKTPKARSATSGTASSRIKRLAMVIGPLL